jgi:PAS domain S-box-containing protein
MLHGISTIRPALASAKRLPLDGARGLTLALLFAASTAVGAALVPLPGTTVALLALLATVGGAAFGGRAGGAIAAMAGVAVVAWQLGLVETAVFAIVAVAAVATVVSIREQVSRLEEVRGEQARTREWLQAIVDALPVGIVVREPSGRLLLHNERAVELYGAPPPLSLSTGLVAPRGPDGRASANEMSRLSRMAMAGETVRGSEMHVRVAQTGGERHLIADVTPLEADGRVVALVTTLSDITPLKDVERERADFVSLISHEIKSPLTAVQAHAQLVGRLLQRHADEARVLAAVDQLVGSVYRTRALIDELSDLSLLRSGRFELAENDVDLAVVIRSAVERNVSRSDRHQIVAAIPDEPLRVICDEFRMEQVLDNLIANAIQYSHAGDVQVVARREGGRAVVRVVDRGMGVPSAERDRIFDAFYRATNARDRRGTGLGLYISRDIARRSGGELWLELTGADGSTFALALPLADDR